MSVIKMSGYTPIENRGKMKSKVWTALLALYIVWGSTYLGIRFAIETIPPFLHAGIRFLISGLILVIWQRAAGRELPTRKQWISTAIVGTLLLVGGNGLVAWAEQFIPSGIAALVISSSPMFLVIGEAIRPNGVKPNWQGIVGLLIGFVGIFILIGPAEISGSTSKLNPLGVTALLTACLLWSTGSIYSKSVDLPKSSLMNTGAQMLMGSVGLFLVSWITGEWNNWDVSAVSSRSLYGLSYLILVGSLIGFASYGWLLQNAPISLVSTYAYVNPIVAVFLGTWLASEPLEPRIWLAAGIIVGSVIFINSTRPKTQYKVKEVLAESGQ
jgi:drug/metabolite transporter (DMT)-like permease